MSQYGQLAVVTFLFEVPSSQMTLGCVKLSKQQLTAEKKKTEIE